VFRCPGETVIVKTGSGATAVWVGNGVKEVEIGAMGVLSTGNNAVLVGDTKAGMVEVGPESLVGGKEVGGVKPGRGVGVRGCRRYDPVIAIDVRVLLALRTSASLAALPPEAIQIRISIVTNRPVIPRACI